MFLITNHLLFRNISNWVFLLLKNHLNKKINLYFTVNFTKNKLFLVTNHLLFIDDLKIMNIINAILRSRLKKNNFFKIVGL